MKRPDTQEYILNVSSAELQLRKTSQDRKGCVSLLGSQLSELVSEVVEKHGNFLREKKRILLQKKDFDKLHIQQCHAQMNDAAGFD